MCKKDYIWNPSTYTCGIDKYSKTNIGDSVNITRDKIIEPTKTNVINLKNEEATFKMDNFYVLLPFLLITIFIIFIIIFITIFIFINGIININDLDLDNILIDETKYK